MFAITDSKQQYVFFVLLLILMPGSVVKQCKSSSSSIGVSGVAIIADGVTGFKNTGLLHPQIILWSIIMIIPITYNKLYDPYSVI